MAVHQNYVGTDSEKQPFFLSVVLTDSNNQGVPQYKAILWKKTVIYSNVFQCPMRLTLDGYSL